LLEVDKALTANAVATVALMAKDWPTPGTVPKAPAMQPPTAAAAAWPLLTWPPIPTVAAPVAAPPIQPVTAPVKPTPPDTTDVSESSITYILGVLSIKFKKYTLLIEIVALIQVIFTSFFAPNFSVKKITKYAKQIPTKQLNVEVFIMYSSFSRQRLNTYYLDL